MYCFRFDCIATQHIRFELSKDGPDAWEVFGAKSGEFHRRFEASLATASRAAFAQICPHNSSVPPQYVLRPPADVEGAYRAGQQFSFSTIVFPRAAEHYEALIRAAFVMGITGLGSSAARFEVVRVQALHPLRLPEIVWEPSMPFAEVGPERIPIADLVDSIPPAAPRSVVIEFESPLWIAEPQKKEISPGKVLERIVRGALERMREMSLANGPITLPGTTERSAVEAAARNGVEVPAYRIEAVSWGYRSKAKARTDTHHGWVGALALKGDLSLLMPVLRIGEWTHVGKHTSFGLGRYAVHAYSEAAV